MRKPRLGKAGGRYFQAAPITNGKSGGPHAVEHIPALEPCREVEHTLQRQFGGFAQLPVQQDFVASACQGVFDAAQRIHRHPRAERAAFAASAVARRYIARPEIKPREILSSVRSLFETKEETDLREIREAMECKPDKPLSRGERYALAMKEYWRRQVKSHWGRDQWLESNDGGDVWRGYITINERMCGLKYDWFDHPEFMKTDFCYSFRLDGYPTLETLLKKQPEFVSEHGNSEFADVVRKNLGGKKYDPAGEGFLQKPEHFHYPSRFGVLKTESWDVWFYAEDCCTLDSYQEFVAYLKQTNPLYWQSRIKRIPIEVREKAEYLTVKYTSVPSKIDDETTEGDRSYDMTYLVNPCGELVFF